MDKKWWDFHRADVDKVFSGERYSHGERKGVVKVRHPFFKQGGQNSGAGAIALAHHFGARRVILLGYDCSFEPGTNKRHWHGDHERNGGSGNAGSVNKWPAQFKKLLGLVSGMDVVNCSRRTALTTFPLAKLEDVL